MKKSKCIIASVLFMVGYIFTGEIFMQYLDNFEETYYCATFSFSNIEIEKSHNEIIHDFLDAADTDQVDFFAVDKKINSEYEKTVKIYGTQRALKAIADNDVKPKEYQSLFSGHIKVDFLDFSEMERVNQQQSFYFIGENTEPMTRFVESLSDKYSGTHPIAYDSIKSVIERLRLIWGIIFFVIILLTIYDITLQRKEYTVQVILGYNLWSVFFRNIISDTVILSGIYTLTLLLLKKWMNVYFLFGILATFFFIFLVINVCVNLLVFKVNVKKNFSNMKAYQGILKVNYMIKIVTWLLVSLAVSVNIGIIKEWFNYCQQQEFFDRHSRYEYFQLNYKANSLLSENDGIVAQEFYRTFFENSLIYADLSEVLSINYPTVLVNRYAKREMTEENAKWRKIFQGCDNEKVYIAIPEALKEKDSMVSASQEICSTILDYKEKIPIIYYDEPTRLIAFNSTSHQFKSEILKNPIVVFDNTVPAANEEIASRQLYYAYDILYDISDKEADKFIKKHHLENEITVITNSKDFYEYNRKIEKRFIRISIILATLAISLEALIIFMIVKLEYVYNIQEITLLKILGYSQVRRISKLLFTTLACSLITETVLLVYCLKYKYAMIDVVVCILIFSLLDFLIIFWRAKKLERLRICMVLKGGI